MANRTRREFMQQIAAAAAGLWPAFAQWRNVCAAEAQGQTTQPNLKWLGELRKTKEWRRLDRLWDEMTTHAGLGMRWPRGAAEQQVWRAKAKQFDALKESVTEAVDAVSARMAALGANKESGEALRTLCSSRHYHIWRSRYMMATCYKPSYIGHLTSRSCSDLEKQFATLRQLQGQGKLTPAALEGAAKLIAQRVEVLRRAQGASRGQDRQKINDLMESLGRQTGSVPAGFPVSPPSTECATIAVELTRH